MDWLRAHEFLAIWLEGVALVLIFVWDRLDSRNQHTEMLAQLKATEKQIEASEKNAAAAKTTAESIVNAERAWVMADLDWWDNGLRVSSGTSHAREGGRVDSTTANLKLACKNEGRSPAWIENIRGYIEVFSTVATLTEPSPHAMQSFGPMGPLGPGQSHSRSFQLTCLSPLGKNESLSVYAVIDYRDIFGTKRETLLGYSIAASNFQIHRQDTLPERNRNT